MLTPGGGVVVLVILEAHVVEAALIAPEVGNDIANGHHRGSTAGVNVRTG